MGSIKCEKNMLNWKYHEHVKVFSLVFFLNNWKDFAKYIAISDVIIFKTPNAVCAPNVFKIQRFFITIIRLDAQWIVQQQVLCTVYIKNTCIIWGENRLLLLISIICKDLASTGKQALLHTNDFFLIRGYIGSISGHFGNTSAPNMHLGITSHHCYEILQIIYYFHFNIAKVLIS